MNVGADEKHEIAKIVVSVTRENHLVSLHEGLILLDMINIKDILHSNSYVANNWDSIYNKIKGSYSYILL